MRIAITGASGFLGKYLVRELAAEELLLLSRSQSKLTQVFELNPHLNLVETDYSLDSLTTALENTNAVVHLGAIRPQKRLHSFLDYLDNIWTSENLFKACEKLAISNVVFASTRSLYTDLVNTIPFREDEPVHPMNLYAISKLTAEKIGFLSPTLNLKCLRLAQLVGVGEREEFMLMTFISRALARQPLTLYGKGQGKREYLYAKDAARAIKAALSKEELKGVFNIGSGVCTSHRELAESVCKVFADNEIDIIRDETKSEDRTISLMDSTKAAHALGWTTEYSLESALQEMKEVYKLSAEL